MSNGHHSVQRQNESGRHFRFGFDIGGTFTDFVLLDVESGEMHTYKTLTTPHQPSHAVLAGWHRLLADAAISGDAVDSAIHGTTLITNALIERKGAVTALITTAGFGDVLDTQREMRYDIYDLHSPPVRHLIPRPLRFEVDERTDAFGHEIAPLAEHDLVAMLEMLETAGVDGRLESVAVCLLNAFANPSHEQAIASWLADHLSNVAVSLSHQVAPEIREYERMSTTVCNAYVQPMTERYLRLLQQELGDAGFPHRLHLMLSSGGITSLETAAQFPIRLVESGPAAGALAAVFYGDLLDTPDLVSFDMGGTTAKLCLIRDGQPAMTDTFEVARVHRFKRGSGLPVRIPSIEMIEIGAGGGSIARIDELGLLKVGPASAGADPGPACYGNGGTLPTVTDADLLLGYLNPANFLGGRMALDVDAADEAVAKHIAAPLGLTVTAAAHGIHQVVNENMISAARVHVAERGADPRHLRLIAFGGAGPVHAHQIARALKMHGYICPANAGVTSALGFLTAPIAFELAQTFIARMSPAAIDDLAAVYVDLEREGRLRLAEAGVPDADMRFFRQADLRHAGQGHEIVVAFPDRSVTDGEFPSELRARFDDQYEAIYGHVYHHLDLEITTCRLTATGPRPLVQPPQSAAAHSGASPQTGERQVFFAETDGFVMTPVYDRTKLSAGFVFPGPAIVEEPSSTAVIGPETTVMVDEFANLLVTLHPLAATDGLA